MTGELTLTGRILPIGGLKEKLLAAIRNGMEEVLLPADNREDWEELNADIKKSLKAHFVDNAWEAFGILFPKGILRAKKNPAVKSKPSTKEFTQRRKAAKPQRTDPNY
jgi:ATP-dependent Lon protease